MPVFSLKKKVLTIIICSIVLTIVTGLASESRLGRITAIERPGRGKKEEVIVSVVEEGQKDGVELGIDISAKELSYEEANDILNKTADELPTIIKGSNVDTEHVTRDLKLPTLIKENGIKIDWTSSAYEVIAYDGEVFNNSFEKDESKEVVLTADLQLGNQNLVRTLNVKVRAPEIGEEEQFKREVEKAIKEADIIEAKENSVVLPEKINGKKVDFYFSGEKSLSWMFLPLGVVLCIVVYISERKKAEEREKLTREELEKDYGTLTSRLALLCGAGINVYGAWKSIADNYISGNRRKKKKRVAYENMLESINMINNGMCETEAYIRFGNKCGIKEYKKLGAYLSEYVKKGSGNLAKLLKEEADDSLERRKAQIKVKAQEASIKMMLPMVLMLGVVMAIVMLPAFISFAV